jgi:hypothetical protein
VPTDEGGPRRGGIVFVNTEPSYQLIDLLAPADVNLDALTRTRLAPKVVSAAAAEHLGEAFTCKRGRSRSSQ